MEQIEAFKKLRDACDDIVNAYDKEDEKELETAMGRFLFLCMQLQSLK
ncbi:MULTISPECIES: hypothetical protein [unclassified Bacillus (in: firmicutes)]|nr:MULTISPECIES: hypothetical protein [unclassified Bacillus (in: firmicutes)]MBT2615320.1 hypothetical protein [Bacillus sp. ISL-78]MBT2628066.1 hypothetical protein [Bacillus sp. ISL-101]